MKTLLIFALALGFSFGSAPQGVAADTPKRGGTVTMAVSRELAIRNPLVGVRSTQQRLLDLMYDPLLGKDLNGDLRPSIAESWRIGKDGLLYTFKLRKGAKFHNGQEVTSRDVKFSIDYVRNAKNGAYGFKDLAKIDRVEATDKYTLAVHMKKIDPVLLTALTSIRTFSVLPAESVPEGIRRVTKLPPGTGPFKFGEWRPGVKLVLERFADYWGHKAFIDRLVIRPISNATVRFTALRTGDVDLIERTPYEWVNQVMKGKVKGVGIARSAYAGGRNIEFNVADPPFDNKKLRLAVAHAFDKEEILRAAFLGFAEVANQRIPKGEKGYHEIQSPKQDRELAKKYLKESGYKGQTIELLGSRGDAGEIEATVIQAQLKKIGMDVKITVLERSSNLVRRRSGQYAFKMKGGRFYAHPLLAYNEFKCEKNLRKRRTNEAGYCNKKFDALIAKASEEADQAKQDALLKQIVNTLMDDLPIFPLGFTPRFFTFRNQVKNFQSNQDGDFRWWAGGLNYVWLDK